MPARFKRVAKALRKSGVQVVRRAGKGSHAVLDDGKGNLYTIPLTNGDRTELSDVYLRGLCRAFGLDFDAFKRLV
ncbi:MAG: hypothetical protein HY906_14000 [Deltaproteobacteria bacterium]|nr:hypothetical protein [Deltaproteobacteria bacterium]